MSQFLETMPPLERHRAARVLALCPTLSLRAGEALGPGAFPEAAFLVVEQGVLALASGSCSGRRVILAFATEGSLLPPPKHDETLAAMTNSMLITVIPAAHRALLQYPVTAEEVVAQLLAVIRERQESLAQFANVAHAERLRGKLLQLARLHGTSVDGRVSIELPLTHELLGQAIGSARETVTISLRALEREGFLVREGHSYVLMGAPQG